MSNITFPSGNSTGHRVDRMTGHSAKVGTSVVEVLEVDNTRDVLFARGATVPADTDAGFAKGCLFIDTDASLGAILYLNEGTATSADFNVVESGASSVTGVTAGNGLTGGGTSGTVTLNAVAGDGITVAADSISLASTTAGDGLSFTTGVLAVGAGTGLEVAANTVGIAAGGVDTTQLAADAVENAQLADDAVSLENLDAGITPSHIVMFAGKHTTAGGDTSETITATGALSTDLVFVQVESGNSGPVVTAVPSSDAITVLLTADPSTDDVLTWQVLRAVS